MRDYFRRSNNSSLLFAQEMFESDNVDRLGKQCNFFFAFQERKVLGRVSFKQAASSRFHFFEKVNRGQSQFYTVLIWD